MPTFGQLLIAGGQSLLPFPLGRMTYARVSGSVKEGRIIIVSLLYVLSWCRDLPLIHSYLFPPSLLEVILVVHAATYQSADKSHIGDGVGLSGAALETFLKAQANDGVVARVVEDRVVFAFNKENQPRVRKFKETVDLQNMLGILNRLAA